MESLKEERDEKFFKINRKVKIPFVLVMCVCEKKGRRTRSLFGQFGRLPASEGRRSKYFSTLRKSSLTTGRAQKLPHSAVIGGRQVRQLKRLLISIAKRREM